MKKLKIILIVLLIALIVLWVLFFLNGKVFNKDSSKEEMIEKETKQIAEEINNEINEDNDNEKTDEKKDKDYDQYLVASGYSGASDNVYYTKDGDLYHLNLSTSKTIKVAEGVLKIESGKGTIIVHKDKNFKILEEDSYLNYAN